ncbi:MAG: dynamin family protein [Comamonadaceae bacterium]|nr:dynamin family protein [Comamonadaceae bacterium]
MRVHARGGRDARLRHRRSRRGRAQARRRRHGRRFRAWRHAVINFPHPLLQQGLVILDTPGLNAIGAEPELTLSLLPNAHAVLFILAADTGVTQSDMAVWRDHRQRRARPAQRGRIVVLNKIDGLWDGLRHRRGDRCRDRANRSTSVADTLDLSTEHSFPGFGAEGAGGQDQRRRRAAGERSRLPQLEQALMQELIPAKQEIVGDGTRREVDDIARAHRGTARNRVCSSLREQLQELSDLRGKNQGVIEYMMRKVKAEKDEFERGLQQYYAVRSVFTTLTNKLYGHLGMDAIRERDAAHARSDARGRVLQGPARCHDRLLPPSCAASSPIPEPKSDEITRMLEAMYKRFSVEHGLRARRADAAVHAQVREGDRPAGGCALPPS